MHDQADELRQLVRQRAVFGPPSGPSAPLVVVSGGQPGVGTTTVAINLALALARQGRRAVYVDADLEHGGQPIGREQTTGGTVLDVLAGRRTVHEVLERGPAGIQVVPGATVNGDASNLSTAAQQRFISGLQQLAPHVDVVVIDAGSRRDLFARRLWQAAGSVVVVTTADDASVMQAYSALKALLGGNDSLPVYTFVTAAESVLAADVHSRIAEAGRRFLGLRIEAAGHAAEIAGGDREGSHAGVEFGRSFDPAAECVWSQLQFASQTGGSRSEKALL